MQFQEFPKWINVPGHEDGGVVVFNAEEEKIYGMQEKEASEEVKRKPGRPKKVQE